MYYSILIISVGVCLTYSIYCLCMKSKKDEEKKNQDNGTDRIDKIFENISSKKIMDILNNQEDYRTASSELDKKLFNLIKKEM